MTSAIEISGVSKSERGNLILEDVSLKVPAGSMLGLIGRSGAGKTTTLKILLGIVAPTRGSSRVLEVPSSELYRKSGQIGACLDPMGLEPQLTLEQNLHLHCLRYGKNGGIEDSLLEALDLAALRRRKTGLLSQGELQRLSLARALLLQPDVLILDEPIAHLDPGLSREVLVQLRSLVKQRGLTVLLSSHQLFQLERHADHLALIHHGKILLNGSLRELLKREGARYLLRAQPIEQVQEFLRAHPLVKSLQAVDGASEGLLRLHLNADDPASINESLVQRGMRVSTIQPEQASLEDVFHETILGWEQGARMR